MKKIILVIATILFFLTVSTCIDQSTPPEEKEKYKDPREMMWTLDTIYYPGSFQTLMRQFAAF